MALCHLRNLPLFAWRELQPVPSVSRLAEEHLRWNSQRSPSCRVLLLECSAKKSKFFFNFFFGCFVLLNWGGLWILLLLSMGHAGCTVLVKIHFSHFFVPMLFIDASVLRWGECRGSRNTKTTRSDADLCNELRHFVLAMGLPEDHVPSTKELLEHGRKDLAYIVRRRGHKEITKLLMNPTIGDTTMEKHVENDCHFGKVSTEESIEFQETLDIYDMEAESSQEGTTSCRQSSELKIAGGIEDSLERQDAVICNGHKFNSSMNNADGADENNMGSQLLSPLRRGQYSRRFNNTFSVQFLDELQHSLRDDVLEEILCNSDFDDSKGSDLAEEKANEVEVDHLKELLRQKESELALLKQQIEEEKFALSTMQNKAEAEITKVQNIIATKDHELQATEESLSGLKEVLIEYWGNGETVEVAGSFNGWQQRVKMDPHTSSNPNGTRESILWSTILWLYPGIYEIKFVVDGHWKIDAQRELVPRGAITNNVLRVEG